jgi:hypothetical protein
MPPIQSHESAITDEVRDPVCFRTQPGPIIT